MAEGPEPETAVLPMVPPAREPPPSTSAHAPRSMPSASVTAGVGSPLEALERDELMRTRRFCYITITLALLAASAIVLTPGDPLALKIVLGAIAIGISSMLWILYRSRDPVRFRAPVTAVGWLVPALGANAAVLFYGVFSPAPMVAVLGLYFLGLGKSARMALLGYAVCAVFHAVTGVLFISGAVRDVGVIQAHLLSLDQQIIVQLLVQLVLAATMITARMSRKTALMAVGELEQAVRIAAHRQALLLEAREELDRALRPGRGRFSDQVIGSYQLGSVLGRGAMGEVYEATTADGNRVAIKLLGQASLGNSNHVMRFLRELRMAAAIESPHVVRVLEVGEHPVPYLVMERLEGSTLAEVLREQRSLATQEIVEMIAQVGRGITAAAATGVVHRDLKPQNVFRHAGAWKILDFGVARGADDGDTLTAGQVVGTPSYMAPEQASGDPVDHRTDLYALGAIAYRALTGQPPFVAGEVAETLYRVVHTKPTRPTLIAPTLDPDVDLVFAVAMATRPGDRFAHAGELSDALRDALAGKLSPRLRARGEGLMRSDRWGSTGVTTRAAR